MRTWIFDLDGTICTQEKHADYHLALPIDDVITKIRTLHALGDRIIIFTARGMNTFNGNIRRIESELRTMTERWLRQNDVPYHELIFGKPPGDVYVDDKGMNVRDFAKTDRE